jgi:magnesium transporter
LLCNITGGVACAFLCGLFQADLKRTVALALFIPVVLSLGESVSIQSLSLSLQLLHGKAPSWFMILQKLRHELCTGLMLGAASGFAVGVVAIAWIGQWPLIFCLLGGITGGVACAAVLGALAPNVLHRLRLDPQVAAGPIALAVTDVLVLLCYFSLARWLLS